MADGRDPHAEHDPLVVAALLDRDIGAEERAIAQSWIASCASCAALHVDLLALSVATRANPTPPRPRAFTLTATDAARLAGESAREPRAAAPRLGGVMTHPSTPSDHALHDTMLVASLADHSLASSERVGAEALVAACGQCADLHADLVALRAATRAMPTPARPSDYTLTARDAQRLRSGGWRRFVAILGTSRDALSRPLAVGLTTLGLAGLLVANVPSFSFGSGAATSGPILAPVGDAAGNTDDGSRMLNATAPAEAAASEAPAASAAAAAPAPALGTLDGSAVDASAAPPVAPGFADAAGASGAPDIQGSTSGSAKGQGGAPARGRDTTNDLIVVQDIGGVSPLVVLSIAFLITGLGLFAMRWTARRIWGD